MPYAGIYFVLIGHQLPVKWWICLFCIYSPQNECTCTTSEHRLTDILYSYVESIILLFWALILVWWFRFEFVIYIVSRLLHTLITNCIIVLLLKKKMKIYIKTGPYYRFNTYIYLQCLHNNTTYSRDDNFFQDIPSLHYASHLGPHYWFRSQ